MRTDHAGRAGTVVATLVLLCTGLALTVASAPAAHAACSFVPAPSTTTAPTTPSGFHPVTPVRLLDTRTGTGAPAARVDGGCEIAVAVPATLSTRATAVALTVTAVGTSAPGYLTVHPCDLARGASSNVNPRLDSPTPNLVVTPLMASRLVCVYASSTTDLIVDMTGWLSSGGAPFHAIDPVRAVDTRSTPRPDPGTAPIPAQTVYEIPLRAFTSPQAEAVAVNLTVVAPSGPGYLTAFPCGQPTPNASVVNFRAGEVRANQALVGLGATGSLCVVSNVALHLVVDVSGWFGGNGGLATVPVPGTRVLDSRTGTGGWAGAIPADTTRPLDPTLGGAITRGASAALLNITVTNAKAPGYLVAYACSSPRPASSSVNEAPGITTMNMVAVPLGTDGTVCIYSSAPADVIVDAAGQIGVGSIASLGVTSAAAPTTPLLTPGFTGQQHDYTVACGAGSNSLEVNATAVVGATLSVNGGAQSNHVDTVLPVTPNAAVVVRTNGPGSATDEYWIRCLPPDFPPLIATRPVGAAPGWYLFTQGSYAIITDDFGVPVWYHDTHEPVTSPPIDLKRLANGDLLWTPQLGGAYGTTPSRGYEIHHLDGSLVRVIRAGASPTPPNTTPPTDHHDSVALPNGDFLVVAYAQRAGTVDLRSIDPAFTSTETVLDGVIQEIAPNGSVVWEWNSKDHVDLSETQSNKTEMQFAGFPPLPPGPADLLHINSIDVAANGDIIVSARHLNSVFRIDKTTKQIVWKIGGSGTSHDSAPTYTFVNDPHNGFVHQHDARLSADGSVLTVFDNRTGRPGEAARAAQYELDPNAHHATLLWSHDSPTPAPSPGLGSVRHQADGATVIAYGFQDPFMQEVDADGTVLLQMSRGAVVPVYRVVKEPLASFDRATLRADAGL